MYCIFSKMQLVIRWIIDNFFLRDNLTFGINFQQNCFLCIKKEINGNIKIIKAKQGSFYEILHENTYYLVPIF